MIVLSGQYCTYRPSSLYSKAFQEIALLQKPLQHLVPTYLPVLTHLLLIFRADGHRIEGFKRAITSIMGSSVRICVFSLFLARVMNIGISPSICS